MGFLLEKVNNKLWYFSRFIEFLPKEVMLSMINFAACYGKLILISKNQSITFFISSTTTSTLAETKISVLISFSSFGSS